MKTVILFFLLIIFTYVAFSQSKGDGFWGAAIGLKGQSIRDNIVSPLLYSGTNLYGSVNHYRYKSDRRSIFEFEGSIGTTQSRFFEPDQNQSRFIPPISSFFWNSISYSHFRKMNLKDQSENLFLGAGLNHFVNLRINERWDSSMINFVGGPFLNAKGLYQKTFRLNNKEITGNLLLGLPIFGYLIRPNYVGVPNFINHEKEFLAGIYGRGYFVSIFTFPKINWELWLDYPIANNNRIRFNYQWEFYSFKKPHQMKAYSHNFSVNFMMKTR